MRAPACRRSLSHHAARGPRPRKIKRRKKRRGGVIGRRCGASQIRKRRFDIGVFGQSRINEAREFRVLPLAPPVAVDFSRRNHPHAFRQHLLPGPALPDGRLIGLRHHGLRGAACERQKRGARGRGKKPAPDGIVFSCLRSHFFLSFCGKQPFLFPELLRIDPLKFLKPG